MHPKYQNTLKNSCFFEGKGLHTGRYARMSVEPAPENTGIRFIRTDISSDAIVGASAENVSNTARSTTICENGVSVVTIEHLLSALTGVGIDNAIIRLDNIEVPILDGSAQLFLDEFIKAGICSQDAPRKYLHLEREIEYHDSKSGSWIKVEPSEQPEIDITVDFNSRVLGVQTAHWDLDTDYVSEIGPCRTFVFFHEIEFLANQGLVKGGDMDNAIVIIEHPVSQEHIYELCDKLGLPKLAENGDGYLNNIRLHFPNECGRHKLLDIIGDLRLSGGWLNAKVTAFKPGHSINTNVAKEIRKALLLK